VNKFIKNRFLIFVFLVISFCFANSFVSSSKASAATNTDYNAILRVYFNSEHDLAKTATIVRSQVIYGRDTDPRPLPWTKTKYYGYNTSTNKIIENPIYLYQRKAKLTKSSDDNVGTYGLCEQIYNYKTFFEKFDLYEASNPNPNRSELKGNYEDLKVRVCQQFYIEDEDLTPQTARTVVLGTPYPNKTNVVESKLSLDVSKSTPKCGSGDYDYGAKVYFSLLKNGKEYKSSASKPIYFKCGNIAKKYTFVTSFIGIPPGNYKLCFKNIGGSVAEGKCKSFTRTNDFQSFTLTGTEDTGTGDNNVNVLATNEAAETVPDECIVETIGWLVCPVFNFLAKLADGAYTFISDKFLKLPVSIFNTNGATNNSWSYFRNFANLGIALVLLIIIFSQITGFGISNYGVKKMLPRLIVGAVLMNLSFWICALAVDLSNVLGKSLYDAFGGLANTIKIAEIGTDVGSGPSFLNLVAKVLYVGVGLGAIVAAGGVWAAVIALAPILLAAVLALAMTFLILIAREALVILLVVLSPVAFLAYLLPNTEKLFTQWRKAFTGLLLVYPSVGLLFGGAKLASGVLTATFTADEWGILPQILAAAVGVLPLFLLPGLLKSSLKSIPAIGKFASKMQERANQRVKKKGKEAYENTDFARNRALRKDFRKDKMQKQWAKRSAKGGALGMVRGAGIPGSEFRKYQEAQAQSAVDKAEKEQVAAAGIRLKNMRKADGSALSKEDYRQLASTGQMTDSNGKTIKLGGAERKAAIDQFAQSADAAELARFIEDVIPGEQDVKMRQHIAAAISGSAGAKGMPGFGGSLIGAIEQGGSIDMGARIVSDIEAGKVTAETMLGMGSKDLELIQKAARGSSKASAILASNARKILDASVTPEGRFGSKSTPVVGSELHDKYMELDPGWVMPLETKIRSGDMTADTFEKHTDEEIGHALSSMSASQLQNALDEVKKHPDKALAAAQGARITQQIREVLDASHNGTTYGGRPAPRLEPSLHDQMRAAASDWTPLGADVRAGSVSAEKIANYSDEDIGHALIDMEATQIHDVIRTVTSHPDPTVATAQDARIAEQIRRVLDASHNGTTYGGRAAPALNGPEYAKLKSLLPSYTPPPLPTP